MIHVIVGPRYASFYEVLQALLRVAGVAEFAQLNVGNPTNVPCLAYLWQLQQKVDAFILAFVAGR